MPGSTVNILLFAFVLLLVYCWRQRQKALAFFKKLGIPCVSAIPIFGSTIPYARKGFVGYDLELAKKYKSTYGMLDMMGYTVFVVKPQLIKKVFIGDFSNFVNRRKMDIGLQMFKTSLTELRDEEWKRIRSILSPTFTSGKLKGMVGLVNNCSEQLVKNLALLAEKGDPVDMKEYFGCFALDAIASTAFGLKLDTFNDKEGEYVQNVKKITGKVETKTYFAVFFPKIAKFLTENFGVQFIDLSPYKYFSRVVEHALRARAESGNQEARDFLQLVSDAEISEDELKKLEESGQPKPKKGLTREEIISNAVVFIIGGYDTTATTLSFVAYNLACNPDWQDKLREEILNVVPEGEITYEHVKQMRLMDNVINETLRLYAPAFRLERQCGTSCDLDGVHIPAGTVVGIPVFALHYNEEYHPNPEVFDPDRFADDDNNPIKDGTFLPFGLGPRECIARRLALLEIKICFARLLREMSLTVCSKTQIPIEFEKMTSLIKAKGGIWLKVEKL